MIIPQPKESSGKVAFALPPGRTKNAAIMNTEIMNSEVVNSDTQADAESQTSSRLEPTEELLAELARENERLESATPQEIITWATQRFGDKLTMATAFGAEGMTILYMLSKIAPETDVFNLDTGYQFQETLDLRDRVEELYGINVRMMKPELTVEQYEAKHGGPLYKTNPNQCCFDRKLTVLNRAIEGKHAWMSAIRRDQSLDRARTPIVFWDERFSLVKISPLANETKNSIWKMTVDEKIPYNPLYDDGYSSIGCWPCTRRVQIGEDERAGRWSGTNKVECGLHTRDE